MISFGKYFMCMSKNVYVTSVGDSVLLLVNEIKLLNCVVQIFYILTDFLSAFRANMRGLLKH